MKFHAKDVILTVKGIWRYRGPESDSRIYYGLRIYVYPPMKLSKLNVHHDPVEKPTGGVARDKMTSLVRLCLDEESH